MKRAAGVFAAGLALALLAGCSPGGDPGAGGTGGMTNGPGDQTSPGPTGSGRQMPGGNMGGGQAGNAPSVAGSPVTPR
jgi:hypothetical protein